MNDNSAGEAPVERRVRARPAAHADSWAPKTLLREADKLRRTSKVCLTCPASRHTLLIGRGLVSKKGYPMLEDETEHCVGSILATVVNLWETRAKLARLRALALAAMPANWQDAKDTAALARELGLPRSNVIYSAPAR